MERQKHIHCIGIGGIGLSAIARYYLALGYRVTGTNLGHSPLLDTLAQEGIEIVENGSMMIDRETSKVIYTEAIIDDNDLGLEGVRDDHRPEIKMAQFYAVPLLSYPEALAEVFHTFPIKIAVAGAHGKSTTSAMLGTLLHDTKSPATTITGTLVKAFGGKNVCIEGNNSMVIEACEYRNAFLRYHADIAVITNIDPDHLDFFKTADAYFTAFGHFMAQSRCVVILAEEYQRFQEKMKHEASTIKHDNTLILVHSDYFEVIGADYGTLTAGTYPYSLPKLLVPGHHIRLDASLAYVTSQILHIAPEEALKSLKNYPGSWRRMEIIKSTLHNNLLISDYGHHPTEIRATLSALHEAYPERRIFVFFEPHQYSRTYELREEFATSFEHADMTYVVDIYAARDIDERRGMITGESLAQRMAEHTPCQYVGTLENAGLVLQNLEGEVTDSVLLLLGAGTIDELRDRI